MKTIQKNYNIYIFFILFLLLGLFLPIAKVDWPFYIEDCPFRTLSRNPFTTSLTDIIAPFHWVKALTFAIIFTGLFVMLRNVVNKKNTILISIAIFLYFLTFTGDLAGNIFSTSYLVHLHIPGLFVLFVLNRYLRDDFYKMKSLSLFLLGFIASLFDIRASFLLLTMSSWSFFQKLQKGNFEVSERFMFYGECLGTLLLLKSTLNIPSLGSSSSSFAPLLSIYIEKLYDTTFLIPFIMTFFLLFAAIKIYTRADGKKKAYTLIAIFLISAYDFAFLLSSNINLKGVLFIGYNCGIFFLLKNATNSILFKKKLSIYFLIKAVALFISILDLKDFGYVYLNTLFDIILILELINNTFPTNFLQKPWYIIGIVILIANINTYKNISSKVEQMNLYIRRQLECSFLEITLPQKYMNESVNIYIPQSEYEKENYLKYLHLDRNIVYNIDTNGE